LDNVLVIPSLLSIHRGKIFPRGKEGQFCKAEAEEEEEEEEEEERVIYYKSINL
jgi:hypothetical protein